jgi:hypothetical protein
MAYSARLDTWLGNLTFSTPGTYYWFVSTSTGSGGTTSVPQKVIVDPCPQ